MKFPFSFEFSQLFFLALGLGEVGSLYFLYNYLFENESLETHRLISPNSTKRN